MQIHVLIPVLPPNATGPNPPVVFRYTKGLKLRSIINSRVIKPSTAHVPPHVKPVAWFSTSPAWEPTATKVPLPGKPSQLMTAKAQSGLVRITVPTNLAPYRIQQLPQIAGTSPSVELCAWGRDFPDATHRKLVAVGIAEARVTQRIVVCDELLTTFVVRASVKPSTRAAYKQTTDSLRKHIGRATPLAEDTAETADIWKKRIIDEGLIPATVAKRVYVARAIFRKAVKWGMVSASPFEEVPAGSQQNPDRSFYVSLEVIAAVLERCPGAGGASGAAAGTVHICVQSQATTIHSDS
jgi:hypothetical protein